MLGRLRAAFFLRGETMKLQFSLAFLLYAIAAASLFLAAHLQLRHTMFGLGAIEAVIYLAIAGVVYRRWSQDWC